MKRKRPTVVLLPGFQGRADQPILVQVEKALSPLGFECVRLAPPRMTLSPGLEAYVDWLGAQTRSLDRLVLIGRSFGGRLAVRLANERRVEGLVLLGFPIRPPGRPRPLDEEALRTVRCKTLILQGSADELGPLDVLKDAVGANPHVSIDVLDGAGHSFGRAQRDAIGRATAWLDALVSKRGKRGS